MESTKATLRSVLVRSLDLKQDPETIPETNLVDELGLNSINTIEFLIWVEGEFDIEIDDADLSVDLIDDLNRLADYVEARLRQPVTD